MKRLLAECDASLALSLNATTDKLRTRLMPHNARWPIDALRLTSLLQGINAQVNVIPHNSFASSRYLAPSHEDRLGLAQSHQATEVAQHGIRERPLSRLTSA